MTPLLLLCHRIPFPPNKGDKVRSYHLLRYLAEHYEVHLGAFVDDPADARHGPALEQWCAELHLEPLDPGRAKMAAARGLLSGAPLTLSYYRSRDMGDWVDEVLARAACQRIVVFSSCMAQYVLHHLGPGVRSALDLVDVDSEKWRQYAASKPWPVSWVYQLESRRLLDFERELATAFDHTVLVSVEEAELFRRLAPEAVDRIVHVSNGVDTEFFNPEAVLDSPYPRDVRPVVFTGAMDYWANIDAVLWFADEVFPAVRAAEPRAVFYVVGARPAAKVEALSRRRGIVVIGTVDDVRPWIAHAAVCVAPLRIARGVQNKVLEAMAMARPLVATPEAIEGIKMGHGLGELSGSDAETLSKQITGVLTAPAEPEMGSRQRDFVVSQHAWASNLARFRALIEGGAADSVRSSGTSGIGDAA